MSKIKIKNENSVLASHPSEPPKITPKSASPFREAEYQIAKAITEARWKKLPRQNQNNTPLFTITYNASYTFLTI